LSYAAHNAIYALMQIAMKAMTINENTTNTVVMMTQISAMLLKDMMFIFLRSYIIFLRS
jgi:hypothetical protein